MPRVRDLLYRFRPSGSPGAATASGVPADRTVELAAELEPVFAQLAVTERECADLRARGRADAEAIRRRDAEEARSILATGRALVEAERASALTGTRDQGEAESRATVLAGQEHADHIRRHVEDSLPLYVDLVVSSVRSQLHSGVPGPGHLDDPS